MYNYKISKLFWGKFPYKVVISAPWVYGIRNITMKNMESVLNKRLHISSKVDYSVDTWSETLRKMVYFLYSHNKKEVSFRCEGSTLSIFFKDKNILNELLGEFKNHIRAFYEPENALILEYLNENIRTEVKNQLTHGCRYKVNLKTLSKISSSNKENFMRIVNDHNDQFHMTDRTRHLFTGERRWYGEGSFFYVKDSKYLLMVQMIIQPAIKEVIKIVTPEELKKEELDAE